MQCTEENSLELTRCVYNCQGNPDCAADCNDDFWTNQLECPCEVNFQSKIHILLKLFYLFEGKL